MGWIRVLSIAASITVIACCFFPWMTLESRNIIVSGIKAEGTNFGKPGYFNLLLTIPYLILAMVPRLWAKRINLFLATLNIAWSLRNFVLLSRCEAGECPERTSALWLLVLGSVVMLLSTAVTPVVPKATVEEHKEAGSETRPV